jgi:ABC-type nitrate/sulfonate/bicarbonate transport system permease component
MAYSIATVMVSLMMVAILSFPIAVEWIAFGILDASMFNLFYFVYALPRLVLIFGTLIFAIIGWKKYKYSVLNEFRKIVLRVYFEKYKNSITIFSTSRQAKRSKQNYRH